MQFTTSTIAAISVLFAGFASAAPAANPAPMSLNPEILARANSKLNQYSNPNW